jgi:phosphoglycolate phosphatase
VRKLVLFDIDGTLVWTAGAGRAAISEALLDQMGTTGPIDGYRFDGKTDLQIVVELMRMAGHPEAESEAHLHAVCDAYLALLADALASREDAMRIYPGVEALLDALDANADVVLGLLTGNLERGAEVKLRAAGVDFARFRVGAYGSDAADRAALPPIAAERAVPIMGRRPHGAEIVIIGDTPADVTCGRGVEARAIGVATGRHAVEELDAAGAYRSFETLADTDDVLEAILA